MSFPEGRPGPLTLTVGEPAMPAALFTTTRRAPVTGR